MTNTKLKIVISLRWRGRLYTQNYMLEPGVEHHTASRPWTLQNRHRQTPGAPDGGTHHHLGGSLAQNIKPNLVQPPVSQLIYRGCRGQSNNVRRHLKAAVSKTQPMCTLLPHKDCEGEKDEGALDREKKWETRFKPPRWVGLPRIQSWKFDHWVWY